MMRCSTRVVSAIVAVACCASANAAMAVQAKLEWRALDDTPKDASCQAVHFEHPHALAIDPIGNIYVGNERGDYAIQKISTDGTISTLLDRSSPNLHDQGYVNLSLAVDSKGEIIVGVGGRGTIERLGKDGDLTLLAGQPGRKAIADGPADKAQFKAISAVVVAPSGSIYVADSRTIRRLSTDGIVNTVAGSEHAKIDYRDGQGRMAAFGTPQGLVVNKAGNLIVADGSVREGERGRSTSFGLVREMDPKGLVTTIAGLMNADGGYLDGEGTDSMFTELFGIAIDSQQNIFLTEDVDGSRLHFRRLAPTMVSTTVLNAKKVRSEVSSRDGNDSALVNPTGIAVDPSGTPYFVDSGANRLHRIDKFEVTMDYPQEDIPAYMTTLCAVQNPAAAP